ncbi:hypothetical protein P175DRAFT_0470937 [Aspergillus ochraceoroseus IBT 24754]|uniref:Zn(2)-C6 fungal-type domain-containing protein n=3 Tax=Aspergillus subgen. Nidulantes TaxID=2720870 RepID=A0A0F8W5N7_9EURO|nr:uncharacterized protein P175DRAFT_0470937 [Aspergillus ochraceoroseus IBT 24754]KKK13205.1 hypothetical protein ARAM_000547 [Aspergillus rambellii]KKK22835.1 hypothetical protein AOCH_003839 [Aspergillus ochraceoroseus]PTU24641.1 hypothetical protein P175DRAFT_0470937 [Aspergillus ochraceoroseus IBT 24754]
MNTEQHSKKVRSRRTHRKSKLGCENCKKRRIKCDEQKPACSNCLHHSIDCDFSSRKASESRSESSTPSSRRYTFRHSTYQSIASPLSTTPEPTSHSRGTQCDPLPALPPIGISLADLHLFHHFVVSTYRTLADEAADSDSVWQIHVPQWGFSFPSIQHLILALAALHLGYLNPEIRAQYVKQADDHFTFGVRSVSTVLAQLNSENCQLIYISAVLICFVYFGRGPRAGEYLVFNAKGKSEWLVLLHAVRAILASKQDEIFTGVLVIKKMDYGARDSLPPLLRDELAQHEFRIGEVRALVGSRILDPELQQVYFHAVDDLLTAMGQMYERRGTGCRATDLMPCTMGWTFRLSEKFIERLEEKEPLALIILAYWAILLRYLRDAWFMQGWDEHIITGIRASIHFELHEWIAWPEQVIRQI